MTSNQRGAGFSPGPTWTVLHPAPSSSPSTHTSTWSDFQEEELDMGDDEDEDTHRIHKPPISKRKAPAESPGDKGARKPNKLSRVDLEGHGRANGRRSPSWSPPRSHGPRHASHAVPAQTQPVPSSSGLAKKKLGIFGDRPQTQLRVASTSSAMSSSTDFQETLSQRVQRLNAMEAREQNAGRRDVTARKRTVQPKNVRKVTMGNLLVNAQKTTNVGDTSAAWTRVKPKGKTKRTTLDKEMRPLNLTKDRGGDLIELTDSSDSARRPRPSRNGAGPRPNALASASMDDPIVILSSSEDEPRVPLTQRRKVPPPIDAEVITITDSDEEAAPAARPAPATDMAASTSTSQAAPALPGPSSVPAPVPPSSGAAPATSSPQKTEKPPSAPAPAPSPSTSRVTSTAPLSAPEPPTPLLDDSLGDALPPDDTFDALDDAHFDTTGNDTNDTWDGLGTVLDPLPEVASSEPSMDAADVTMNATAGAVEGDEDTFFDSYLNLDQSGDEETGGDVRCEGNEAEVPADKDPTQVEGGGDMQMQDIDGGQMAVDRASPIHVESGDTRMQSTEDNEVDRNEPPPVQKARSPDTPESGEIFSRQVDRPAGKTVDPLPGPKTRSPDTPESGEIFSQKLGRGPGEAGPNGPPLARKARTPDTPESGEIFSQDVGGSPCVGAQSHVAPVPAAMLASTSIPVERPSSTTGSEMVSSASGSPRSSTSLPNTSQPRVRMGALVMPDISLYKGIRFKRPEARDNSFFSRALGGSTRVALKAPAQEMEAEGSASPSAEVPPSVIISEAQNQGRIADMQDDVTPSGSMSVPEEPTQQPDDAPMVVDQQSTSTSVELQVQAQTSAVANDGLPPPMQPIPSTPLAETPLKPGAPQPLVRSSSRPIIAPPRRPQPGPPMSLAELFNDLRRDQLQQNTSRSTAVSSRETSQGSGEVPTPSMSSSQSRSHSPSHSSTPLRTRTFGRTPSLDGLRSLLAKRNTNKDAPAESVAVPTPTKLGTSTDTTETELASKVVDTAHQPVVCHSPAPPPAQAQAPMSAPGPSSSAARKDKMIHVLPFEAFISPVPMRDRGGEASRSPTVLHAGRGMAQRSAHTRRASASAVFETCIVRASPRERDERGQRPRPPRQPRFSEGSTSAGTGSRAGTDVFAVSDSGVDQSAKLVDSAVEHAMDVDGDVGGIASKEGEGEQEVAATAPEDEVDAADALQELASVHLSQQDAGAAEAQVVLPVPTADNLESEVVAMDVSDECTGSTGARDAPQEIELVLAPVESHSHVTTPDLVLPEDDGMDAKPNGFNHLHERHYSGSSTDECDMLLSLHDRDESGSEEVPSGPSSKTASSTSLAVPPTHSRSPSRATTSSADPLDLLSRPGAVPQLPKADNAASHQPILTWESHVAVQRQRAPVYKLAKNLPHSLQDHMKILPEWFRNSEQGRKIFEAHIREATAGEPDAPPIEIYDNNIGEEVTPAWEFFYTNEMWFAEDVPPPDVKGLESCNCVGRCDPKGNCACARRQFEWVKRYVDDQLIPPTWPGSPFVYDHKGALQRLECPIFECNRFCRCDDDCPNRVVQNGRKWPVHIARTQRKGWGVFAGKKKIPKGTYLGIYAGELLTEREGDDRGRYYDIYGRTYLFSIDFHHLKFDMENADDWENLYVVDAYHAGNFTRFLNHSCDPNCKIFACYIDDADVDKPLLAVFTIRDVEPWEELCFSYYGDIDEKREEIEQARKAGRDMVQERAVYEKCRCEAENCIGRLFG